MRFLVDANLSPVVAATLRDAGHDAAHVIELALVTADDDRILDAAAHDDSVIVTADADFGALLAIRGLAEPSVVLLRSADHLGPPEQAALLLGEPLPQLTGDSRGPPPLRSAGAGFESATCRSNGRTTFDTGTRVTAMAALRTWQVCAVLRS